MNYSKMHKTFILFLCFIMLALSCPCLSFADNTREVIIERSEHGCISRFGKQYQKSDWHESDGKNVLCFKVLSRDNDKLDIKSYDEVGIRFNKEPEKRFYPSSVTENDDGSVTVEIPTDGEFSPIKGHTYRLSVSVYDMGTSNVKYKGMGSSFSSGGVAMIPQTGDGALAFALIAVISVLSVALILSPKRGNIK